jgi:hypothetical protein
MIAHYHARVYEWRIENRKHMKLVLLFISFSNIFEMHNILKAINANVSKTIQF